MKDIWQRQAKIIPNMALLRKLAAKQKFKYDPEAEKQRPWNKNINY